MIRCRAGSPLTSIAVFAVTAVLVSGPGYAGPVFWTGAGDTNWTSLATDPSPPFSPISNWSQPEDPSTVVGVQDVRVTSEMNGLLGSQTINYNGDRSQGANPFPVHNSVLLSGFAGQSMTISHSLPQGLFPGTLNVGGEGGTGIYNQSGGFVNPGVLNLGSGLGGRGTYNVAFPGAFRSSTKGWRILAYLASQAPVSSTPAWTPAPRARSM